MPEPNEQGNGSLTEIVSETAVEARRSAFDSARDEKKGKYRFQIYQRMISEELVKDNIEGALGLIQGLEDDPYCQALGYLVVGYHYHSKKDPDKAKETIDLSLEIARNTEGDERSDLYQQIVDAKLAMEDFDGAKALIKDIDNPFYQSKAYLAIINYHFSRNEDEKAIENLELVIPIARKIEDDSQKTDVYKPIITLKLDKEDDIKGAIELAKEMPKDHYRALSFKNIVFAKVRKNDLEGITELLDEIYDTSSKSDATIAVIDKEVEDKEGEDKWTALMGKIDNIENLEVKGHCKRELVGRRLNEENFNEAAGIAENIKNRWYRSIAYQDLLEFKLKQGDIHGAEKLFENIEEDLYKAQSLVLLSRAMYDKGEKDAAKERLEEAIRFTKEECAKRWVDDLFRQHIIPAQIYEEDFNGAADSAKEIERLFLRTDTYIKLSLNQTEREDFYKAVETLRLAFATAKDMENEHWQQSTRFLEIADACHDILRELKKKERVVPESKRGEIIEAQQSLVELLRQLGQES